MLLCKLLEKLVRESIINHLIQNDVISQHQHGLLPGRSYTTQPLEALDCTNGLLRLMKMDLSTSSMDFQKAFDSVPHSDLSSATHFRSMATILDPNYACYAS